MIKMKYNDHDCILNFIEYADGHQGLELIDEESEFQEPYLTCSSNFEELKDDEIAIKNWSEGEGMYQFLLEKGVITKNHRVLFSGHVIVPVCKITDEWKKKLKN